MINWGGVSQFCDINKYYILLISLIYYYKLI